MIHSIQVLDQFRRPVPGITPGQKMILRIYTDRPIISVVDRTQIHTPAGIVSPPINFLPVGQHLILQCVTYGRNGRLPILHQPTFLLPWRRINKMIIVYPESVDQDDIPGSRDESISWLNELDASDMQNDLVDIAIDDPAEDNRPTDLHDSHNIGESARQFVTERVISFEHSPEDATGHSAVSMFLQISLFVIDPPTYAQITGQKLVSRIADQQSTAGLISGESSAQAATQVASSSIDKKPNRLSLQTPPSIIGSAEIQCRASPFISLSHDSAPRHQWISLARAPRKLAMAARLLYFSKNCTIQQLILTEMCRPTPGSNRKKLKGYYKDSIFRTTKTFYLDERKINGEFDEDQLFSIDWLRGSREIRALVDKKSDEIVSLRVITE
jgi:hypothetical protein